MFSFPEILLILASKDSKYPGGIGLSSNFFDLTLSLLFKVFINSFQLINSVSSKFFLFPYEAKLSHGVVITFSFPFKSSLFASSIPQCIKIGSISGIRIYRELL